MALKYRINPRRASPAPEPEPAPRPAGPLLRAAWAAVEFAQRAVIAVSVTAAAALVVASLVMPHL